MQVFPFSPEKKGNFCAECCDKYPSSWVLREGAVNYGGGGLTRLPDPNFQDEYNYNGMSPGFTSSYCYTGYMTIYVTCNDGSSILTHAFSSFCGTTQILPQSVINPCCPNA